MFRFASVISTFITVFKLVFIIKVSIVTLSVSLLYKFTSWKDTLALFPPLVCLTIRKNIVTYLITQHRDLVPHPARHDTLKKLIRIRIWNSSIARAPVRLTSSFLLKPLPSHVSPSARL